MKPIRKAVFPVAGLGTRFLPATKAIPKEMLPIVDRPLIQYAVDEAREAGIEQMICVTGRGKSAIEDHFDIAFELDLVALADVDPCVGVGLDGDQISGGGVFHDKGKKKRRTTPHSPKRARSQEELEQANP